MRDALALVLAGGAGERLHPLTRDRAKPAVPFGGIYRIIDFTLSNCLNSNLRQVYILTQYKSLSLSRHIRLAWNIGSSSSRFGDFIDVIPPQKRVGESWYLGTADAVYQNIYSIARHSPEYIFILSGDHIYKMNYDVMLDFHRTKGAEVTVGAIEVERSYASRFGVIEVDEEDRIVGFDEKPVDPKPVPFDDHLSFVSMGVYLFNTDVLMDELEKDSKTPSSSHDFGRDVIPRMMASRSIYTYNFRDENKKEAKYWRDIGTVDAYWEANMDLVSVNPIFNFYDLNWPIRTYQDQSPPAKFVFADLGARAGIALDSVVPHGCIVSGGMVKNSILSPGVRINSYSEVVESILMHGVNVGRHSKIRKTIIDKGVQIPEGTIIGYDLEEDARRYMVSPGGVVVVAKEERIVE